MNEGIMQLGQLGGKIYEVESKMSHAISMMEEQKLA